MTWSLVAQRYRHPVSCPITRELGDGPTRHHTLSWCIGLQNLPHPHPLQSEPGRSSSDDGVSTIRHRCGLPLDQAVLSPVRVALLLLVCGCGWVHRGSCRYSIHYRAKIRCTVVRLGTTGFPSRCIAGHGAAPVARSPHRSGDCPHEAAHHYPWCWTMRGIRCKR